MAPDASRHLIVDGNNVMGATPDGWWRDRPAAARRLLARVQCFAASTGASVELVFDTSIPDLPEGEHEGVVVRYATRHGRDAADDRIRELLESATQPAIEVITSDRELASSARLTGAAVSGAKGFMNRMSDAGC
jgi:predicted RNA-binding protein with PIN domain